MTYDKIIKFRDSRTYQYGCRLTEEILFQRRSLGGSNGTIWSLQAAGIPIYSRGSEEKAQVANSGTEGGLHCQTPHKLSFSCQAPGKLYWRVNKQHCYTGPEVISKKKRAWLREIVREKSRWFIVLIGWLIERFHYHK